MAVYRMPFGKFKGEKITEVPVDYLWWCVANLERIAPTMRKAIQAELERRGHKVGPEVKIDPQAFERAQQKAQAEFEEQLRRAQTRSEQQARSPFFDHWDSLFGRKGATVPPPEPPPPANEWERIVGQVRRLMAKKHHPDRGGSIETMAAVNDALDEVLKAAKGS